MWATTGWWLPTFFEIYYRKNGIFMLQLPVEICYNECNTFVEIYLAYLVFRTKLLTVGCIHWGFSGMKKQFYSADGKRFIFN